MTRVFWFVCVLLLIASCAQPADSSDTTANTGGSGPATRKFCEVAAIPPPIPNVTVSLVVGNFRDPVHVTNARDGSGRLFVVQKGGLIRSVLNSAIQSTPFLDIRDRVDSNYHDEAGLFSVAFHPNFKTNGRFFVNYTSSSSKSVNRCGEATFCTVISEFTLGAKSKLEDSERVLLTIAQPFGNHNGGQIMFGAETPAPYLYIGMGDGGSGNDPGNRAQNLADLLGKMLRIDVDKKDAGLPYAIPTDNPPWTGINGARQEIYAVGLRNPWRFSFDPATQFLYAGDVGQRAREEIDIIRKGRNYGWRITEGLICNPQFDNPAGVCSLPDSYDPPVTDYDRTGWGGVTGGVVYRGTVYPEMCGIYFYADYGTGRFFALRYDGSQVIEKKDFGNPDSMPDNIVSFGYDEAYEVYAVDIGNGNLYRLIKAP